MRRETGQTAVEYLIVFSAALVIIALATTTQMIDPAKKNSQDTLYLAQARTAADSIAEAINTVYTNGPGAVKSVSVDLDVAWWVYLENAENSVVISVPTSDSWENLRSTIYYPLDNYHELTSISSGVYTVIVQWPAVGTTENLDGTALENDKIYINLTSHWVSG